MTDTRRHELIVVNDSQKTGEVVEECSTLLRDVGTHLTLSIHFQRMVDEIVLKAPLRHATRAVAIYEQLRRQFTDLAAKIELRDIFVSDILPSHDCIAEGRVREGEAQIVNARDPNNIPIENYQPTILRALRNMKLK
ncbi:uncharacterized protein BXIN_0834 [Babesia sp. Xinjiang]|uniref:uncharacterized protein n=1 Tax=Babesia sp. Xinjiang TaxID=462227 RepID=UPI000A265CA4|nr:uncharacterized protein BXIN_0834 [Babesia sp. Xinjiang]ORM41290.1 hypothetical protein BXIN_0834 [Babesia sp. Xinjiang]